MNTMENAVNTTNRNSVSPTWSEPFTAIVSMIQLPTDRRIVGKESGSKYQNLVSKTVSVQIQSVAAIFNSNEVFISPRPRHTLAVQCWEC